MFQTVVEKIETHSLSSVIFFIRKLAGYEIMWENMVQPDKPQMTVFGMHFPSWVRKATNTHSKYIIIIVFFHNINSYTNAP